MKAISAAQNINRLWQQCLAQNGITIPLENCPSDDEVAAIIQTAISHEDSNNGK